MLFGLTLLTSNLQRLLEILLVHVLLIFEKPSFRKMVLKNLTAHKMRNKMTSLIFSLALGFIIFLIVSYNLQIQNASLMNLQKKGSYLIINSDEFEAVKPEIFDPVIRQHMDKIESFSYVSYDLARTANQEIKSIKASDRARIKSFDIGLYAVTPSIFDSMISDFVKVGS